MPFRSKAQAKWFFWAEKRGLLPKGTAAAWAAETPDIGKLPERVRNRRNRRARRRAIRSLYRSRGGR